jgi:hypothetical protein
MKLDQRFRHLLAAHDIDTLDTLSNVLYGITDLYTIFYFNSAFERFAISNSGEDVPVQSGIGTNVLDAISGSLKDYYRQAFESVLRSGNPFTHSYQCSSPERFREFKMIAYPLAQRKGILIDNSLEVDEDIVVTSPAHRDEEYVDPSGIINMCSNCRRIRSARDQNRWDWAPDIIRRRPKNISHGLCHACYHFYYP